MARRASSGAAAPAAQAWAILACRRGFAAIEVTRVSAQPSFDVTTGCDLQEVDNAVNQATKEIGQRYDFKVVTVGIEFLRDEGKLVLTGPDESRLKAMWEVLLSKMVRRGVPVKNLHAGEIKPAAGSTVRQEIVLQQGIPTETARAIVKLLKDRKLKKVQAAIQGDQVRITSPSRDELQAVIALLKQQDYGIELKFGNYRSG
jgi:uncharacterized protein YajQ (UPF0234 family)